MITEKLGKEAIPLRHTDNGWKHHWLESLAQGSVSFPKHREAILTRQWSSCSGNPPSDCKHAVFLFASHAGIEVLLKTDVQTGIQRLWHVKHSEGSRVFRFLISGWICWNFSPTTGWLGTASIPAEIQAARNSVGTYMSWKERSRWTGNSLSAREGLLCPFMCSSQVFTEHCWVVLLPCTHRRGRLSSSPRPSTCAHNDNTGCTCTKGYRSAVYVAAQVSEDSEKALKRKRCYGLNVCVPPPHLEVEALPPLPMGWYLMTGTLGGN